MNVRNGIESHRSRWHSSQIECQFLPTISNFSMNSPLYWLAASNSQEPNDAKMASLLQRCNGVSLLTKNVFLKTRPRSKRNTFLEIELQTIKGDGVSASKCIGGHSVFLANFGEYFDLVLLFEKNLPLRELFMYEPMMNFLKYLLRPGMEHLYFGWIYQYLHWVN